METYLDKKDYYKKYYTLLKEDRKKYWKPIVIASLIAFAASLIIGFIAGFLPEVISGVVYQVAGIYLGFGFLVFILNIVDGKELKYERILIPGTWKQFGIALVATILMYIVTTIGFFLLIIPGIIASLGLMFYAYFVYDQNSGIIESLKKSWELTDGYKGRLLANSISVGLMLMAIPLILVFVGLVLQMLAPLWISIIFFIAAAIFGIYAQIALVTLAARTYRDLEQIQKNTPVEVSTEESTEE